MLRVRFHGRGGHGIKTASRILGTASFLAGYQTKDSPVYGAERRGAAITAFTRINRRAILERGLIDRPDLIVVGDETLLDDPSAGVLAGQDAASAVFVNAEPSRAMAAKYAIQPPLLGLDLTTLTLKVLGKASALSASLGTASARLIGIEKEHVVWAVREELEHLGLKGDQVDANVTIARAVFDALSPVEFQSVEPGSRGRVVSIGRDDAILATPSILAAGNAAVRHTGSWRLERPEVDYERCTRCGICFVRCPDGAISLDEEGYPMIDLDHCKGCGICWEQCPVSGIGRRKEVRAW